MPYYYPLAEPGPNSKVPETKELTAEQHQKYVTVLKHFSKLVDAPVADQKSGDTSRAPITSKEKAFLTRECLLRYLEAVKWKPDQAITRLENTIGWRRGFGCFDDTIVTPEIVAQQNAAGKSIVQGYDLEGRPCLYVRLGRDVVKPGHNHVRFLVYCIEHSITMLPKGQGQLAIILDFKPTELVKKTHTPNLPASIESLYILQNHYPERLGKAILANMPFLTNAFFKILSPFIDPTTREKIVTTTPFTKYVPADQLIDELGGELEFVYDHEKYWPGLEDLVKSAKETWATNFEKLGGIVGLSETDLKTENLDISNAYNPRNDLGDEVIEGVSVGNSSPQRGSNSLGLAEKIEDLNINQVETEEVTV